ncbi:MAG: beta-N-acetylhexosaminidase, partial [Deltaproteobacteria bacterium]|nr:beta-N-acetylhexosaminidase [Deltaproteobacteria bacterium]
MPEGLPPLLPEPRRAERLPGRFALRAERPIVLGASADDRDFASARLLVERIQAATGRRLPLESHASREGLGPRIDLVRSGEDGEAYRIQAGPEGVQVEADGAAGLRWAVETLSQLIEPSGALPACRISDEPHFRYRGVMLDACRGKVPSAETLFELVDRCARMKLNVLMLHVEHTFHFRRHPEIGADHSPLDAETVRRVDAYAAANHVEFIPCLQSLGHMANILSLERYASLAESDARWTISPADPGTYELLADLYDEYLPNFRSGLFNANCDEPWDLEAGRSQARAAELGRGGVFLEHVRRIRDLAAERGKRTMIWGDVVHQHPGRIPEIDRDLILLDWWYEANHDYDRVKVFAENDLEFWVCAGPVGDRLGRLRPLQPAGQLVVRLRVGRPGSLVRRRPCQALRPRLLTALLRRRVGRDRAPVPRTGGRARPGLLPAEYLADPDALLRRPGRRPLHRGRPRRCAAPRPGQAGAHAQAPERRPSSLRSRCRHPRRADVRGRRLDPGAAQRPVRTGLPGLASPARAAG